MKQPITVQVVTNKGEVAERKSYLEPVGGAVAYMLSAFERVGWGADLPPEEVIKVVVTNADTYGRFERASEIVDRLEFLYQCRNKGLFPGVYDCDDLRAYVKKNPEYFSPDFDVEKSACANCGTGALLKELRNLLV